MLIECNLLSGFIHFLNLLVVHKFRCPHYPSTLAECANLLAKRATCLKFTRTRTPQAGASLAISGGNGLHRLTLVGNASVRLWCFRYCVTASGKVSTELYVDLWRRTECSRMIQLAEKNDVGSPGRIRTYSLSVNSRND